MNNINIFKKYKNKPDFYEDNLTNSFFSLLNYSKLVQIQFLDLIYDELLEKNINKHFFFKRFLKSENNIKEIMTQVSNSILNNYSGTLISILLTDEKIKYESKIENTNRIGILDGLIVTEDDFIFTIENKPSSSNIWWEQLSFKFPEEMEYYKYPIIIEWKTIIKSLLFLIQNEIISFTETKLINDFFSYLNEFFPYLNPYDTFELCNNDKNLLAKRCYLLKEDLDMGEVTYHKNWQDTIKYNSPELKEIAIFPEFKSDSDWELHLDMYPADIMNQARNFYSKVDIKKFMNLKNKEWEIGPNFHFSFSTTGLLWAGGNLDLLDYINYWKKIVSENNLRQQPRNNWTNYLNLLLNDNILTKASIRDFKNQIEPKAYQNINICPGIYMHHIIPKNKVIELETSKKLLQYFSKKIREATSCWEN